MAGLNPFDSIVIRWNTAHLGEAIRQRRNARVRVEADFLAHIPLFGRAHIILTGGDRWSKPR